MKQKIRKKEDRSEEFLFLCHTLCYVKIKYTFPWGYVRFVLLIYFFFVHTAFSSYIFYISCTNQKYLFTFYNRSHHHIALVDRMIFFRSTFFFIIPSNKDNHHWRIQLEDKTNIELLYRGQKCVMSDVKTAIWKLFYWEYNAFVRS